MWAGGEREREKAGGEETECGRGERRWAGRRQKGKAGMDRSGPEVGQTGVGRGPISHTIVTTRERDSKICR